jgi:hypothetical protein
MQTNKTKIIIGAIIIIAVSFFGGYKYGQGTNASSSLATTTRGLGFGGARGGRTSGESFVSGQILSMDAQSITVKLATGGSMLVYVSPSTTIQKTVDGSKKDLTVGQDVTAMGISNTDGSVSANSVQIRPATMATSSQTVTGQ